MGGVIQVESGGEKFIGYAKKKLRELHDYMTYSGVAAFNKRIDVSDGSTIYLRSMHMGHGIFSDKIRITGSQSPWYAADPVQVLYQRSAADVGRGWRRILPATRPGAADGSRRGEWSPTVDDIMDVYKTFLERPRTVGSETVNQEKTIEGAIVLCRYCKRVAEYTWTETVAYDEGLSRYSVTNRMTSVDATHVYFADGYIDEDDDLVPEATRSAAHGLFAAALADSWGWSGEEGVPEVPTPPWGIGLSPSDASDEELKAYLQALVPILEGAAALLDAQLLDAAEIVPISYIPYLDQQIAYVFPLRNTVELNLVIDDEQAPTEADPATTVFATVSCNAKLRDMLFIDGSGFILYEAEVRIPRSPATGADPSITSITPPYSIVFQDPIKYTLDPATKVFSLQTEVVSDGLPVPWFTYAHSYFSSGTDVNQLQALAPAEVGWGGLYRVVPSAETTSAFNSVLGKGDDASKPASYVDPAARMQAMCVGTLTFSSVTYVVYSSIFTTRGATYRQTAHTYTNEGFTTTQDAIV